MRFREFLMERGVWVNEQVSENGDFTEEIESFKDSLDQEYERRIAEIDKKREEILRQIQEM